MPGLWGRFSTLIKSKVSKLLDRAEDPAETLDYSYEKQLELVQNVKRGIADVQTRRSAYSCRRRACANRQRSSTGKRARRSARAMRSWRARRCSASRQLRQRSARSTIKSGSSSPNRST